MNNLTRSRLLDTLLIVLVVLGAVVASVDSGSAVPAPQDRQSMSKPRVIRLHDDRYTPRHGSPAAQAELGIQTATFTVNWNPVRCEGTVSPWPQDAMDAFNYALDIWGSLLNSSEVIVVDACWRSDLPSHYLGQTGSTSLHRDFPNAPIAETYYGSSLANALANDDLNDNDGYDWDNDGNPYADSEVYGDF